VRFFLNRRWLLFAVAVALLAYACVWLGEWQFRRLHERKARNAVVSANLKAAPVPVGDVLSVTRPPSPQQEWRRVVASGHYVQSRTVVVRYQTRDATSGVEVVTPLRTDAGPAVLVDRGWMQTANSGSAVAHVPATPPGQVRVVGWVRVDATGDAATVNDRSTRAISSATIAPTLPFPVYRGFVDAQTETPVPQHRLVKALTPDLGNGPHFFYGLQWWFFGGLAVFGFFYLGWDERRKKLQASAAEAGTPPAEAGTPQRERAPQAAAAAPSDSQDAPAHGPLDHRAEALVGSEGPEHAPVDGQHHAGDERRGG
jgi:cytochrome oxidase assembly protein ShyY1